MNIMNQYAANPENIVPKMLLERIPTTVAIIAAIIFGLSSIINDPVLSKKNSRKYYCWKYS